MSTLHHALAALPPAETPSHAPDVPAASDRELPALRTRVRLFDGLVFVVEEDEAGGEWSNRCLGPLSADVMHDLARAHWAQIEEWLEEEADAVRYGRACREEQMRYY